MSDPSVLKSGSSSVEVGEGEEVLCGVVGRPAHQLIGQALIKLGLIASLLAKEATGK